MSKNTKKAAKLKHEAFLKSIGFRGKGDSYKVPYPNYKCKKVTPTSDAVTYVPHSRPAIPEGAKEFTIAPAYNKGPAMLISPNDIKDIGK
jgi:hypothetical protein